MDCYHGMKLLKDGCVDLIVTDPPYGIDFVPQRIASRDRHGIIPIDNDNLVNDKWVEWFTPISKEMFRVLKQNSVGYFFCGYSAICNYTKCLTDVGFEIKAMIIWVKNNFGLGYHFRRQYECVLVGFKGTPPIPKVAMSDVIFFKKIRGVALLHSCQKPTDLIKTLIKQYTKEGDMVLDPFGGSGTTFVAAKETNRTYLGYETDKKHYKTCLDRLRQSTLFR